MGKFLKDIYYLLKVIVSDIHLFFCGLYIRMFKIHHILFLAPNHGNLGDQAIALSELQFLKEHGITPFEISTRSFDYVGNFFSRMIPKSTVILVHGGGFMGTLWKHEEKRLRKVLTFFPSNRVVIFPQTVTFDKIDDEEKEYFEESKRIYSINKKMTVFVREKKSYEFMKERLPEIDVKLTPDIVTRLKPASNGKPDRDGIVICFRSDHEKKITEDVKNEVLDIVKEKYSGEELTFTDTVVKHKIFADAREREVNDKLRQFAGSKLVITDRLHGMIMAAITNTPCIAFSNSNGKVKNVYPWIKDNEFVRYVDSMEQYKEAIESLDLTKDYKYYIDESLFDELVNAVKG